MSYYKKNFNQRDYDALNSTFVWKILLDTNQLRNGKNQIGIPLVGYTKRIGHPEKDDKTSLLINRFRSAILKNGYLNRSTAIHVYLNKKGDSEHERLLFSVYQGRYNTSQFFWDQEVFSAEDLKFFLEREVSPLFNKEFEKNGLNLADFKIFNEYDFVNTIIDLCYKGYTKEEVTRFMKEYYFEKEKRSKAFLKNLNLK